MKKSLHQTLSIALLIQGCISVHLDHRKCYLDGIECSRFSPTFLLSFSRFSLSLFISLSRLCLSQQRAFRGFCAARRSSRIFLDIVVAQSVSSSSLAYSCTCHCFSVASSFASSVFVLLCVHCVTRESLVLKVKRNYNFYVVQYNYLFVQDQ